jgi:hypothetical protein
VKKEREKEHGRSIWMDHLLLPPHRLTRPRHLPGWYLSNFLSLFHRLFQSILLTLLIVFCLQLMCLADLEFDYINPYDFSSRINAVVFPEFVIQAVLTFFYLVTGHWIMSFFCLPYLYFNVGM